MNKSRNKQIEKAKMQMRIHDRKRIMNEYRQKNARTVGMIDAINRIGNSFLDDLLNVSRALRKLSGGNR